MKRVWERTDRDGIPEECRPPMDFLKAISKTQSGQAFQRQKYSVKDRAKFNDLVESLKRALSDEGSGELGEMAAQGFVRTEMGRNSEHVAIEIARKNPSVGECTCTQQTFEKSAWRSMDGKMEVLILGRIDCLDATDRVMEIKTRFRPNPNVSATEFVQLQTYLFLAEKKEGYVVELLEGDRLHINFLLTFDETWWKNEVIPSLSSFANDLVSSMARKDVIVTPVI